VTKKSKLLSGRGGILKAKRKKDYTLLRATWTSQGVGCWGTLIRNNKVENTMTSGFSGEEKPITHFAGIRGRQRAESCGKKKTVRGGGMKIRGERGEASVSILRPKRGFEK